ncbi:MAG TPA: prolyl oligopeptidase family serine peptidase [Chitinophagaceae bacterium]|nr:prolyl oligopeptidase family serine peptidase [Chitinophagaceae bacterium]
MNYLLKIHNIFLFFLCFITQTISAQAQTFTLQSIKSYPFPNELTASVTGSKIAWALNEEGKRNVYVAEGPSYTPRKLTNYNTDDAQEITSLSISDDGKWVVFVRGGDHGSNWNDDVPVNAAFSAVPPKVQVWSVPFAGGTAKALAEADEPSISPKNDSVVFIKGGQTWIAPLDGSAAAKSLFISQGTTGSIAWAPDGSNIAFVSNRGDHSMIGIYSISTTNIKWIAPSFKRDNTPKWSPDGNQIVFIRTAGGGGPPDSLLARRHQPWSILTADVVTGTINEIWKAPQTLEGSPPPTHGGYNLHWAAKNRIVFLSYMDGWPHLYSISSTGGTPLLLTPGNFMAEHITVSTDGEWVLFAGNTGPDKLDIDRRHVVRVSVDKANMEVLTPGTSLEWSPVATGDGNTVAIISATAQRPPLPAIISLDKKDIKVLASDHIPASYPQISLVTPKQILFKSPDGSTIHGQLFQPVGGPLKKPAIIYVHGGPPRQMLLGWHYSDYYANAYATNQYLANLGFVVLSVNYRLGIGYGFKFHRPKDGGAMGASEYQDIRAAAVWLGSQSFIDKNRIGVYGGSYGGYLTALALSRDSKLFAAGVDIHGVHDWSNFSRTQPAVGGYEKIPDADSVTHLAYLSSPVASVKSWTSPVLIIHADDDRNVQFIQSTDLVKRLEKKGVPHETLVIPGDTHHWMKHSNALTVDGAIADYFIRKLMKK